MTRKIEIKVFDRETGRRLPKEIEATYIPSEDVRRHRGDLGIVYSCPDFWTLGKDLIVYQDRGGRYFYTTRPSFDERRPRRV